MTPWRNWHMDNGQLKLLKSRSIGERFADTFTFLRLNLGLLVKTHLLLSLPIILVLAGLFVLMFPADFSLLRSIDSGPFVDSVAKGDEFRQWSIQTWFNFSAFIPIAANTLIVMDQYARNEGKPVAFDAVFRSFSRNFLKLFIAKLVMGFLVMIGGLLLVVPALVIYTMFVCTEMLMLQHQFGVFKAMGRSWSIMTKGFGNSFFVNGGLFLMFGVFWLALQGMGPVYEFLASYFFDEVREDGAWMLIGRTVGVFNAVLGYMLFMVPAAGAGIQFFSLREEIAKTDILQRIREIGMKEESIHANLHADEHY